MGSPGSYNSGRLGCGSRTDGSGASASASATAATTGTGPAASSFQCASSTNGTTTGATSSTHGGTWRSTSKIGDAKYPSYPERGRTTEPASHPGAARDAASGTTSSDAGSASSGCDADKSTGSDYPANSSGKRAHTLFTASTTGACSGSNASNASCR